MKCYKCDKEIEDSAIFCPYCSARVDNPTVNIDNNVTTKNEDATTAIKSDTKIKKASAGGPAIKLLINLLVIGLLFNLFGTPSTISIVAFVIGVFILQILIFFKFKNTNKNDNAFPNFENLYQAQLSQQDFVEAIIAGEFERKEQQGLKLISKKVLRLRVIFSVAFAILLFLLLYFGFYSMAFWPLVSVLVLVFEIAVLSLNTLRSVFNLAKAQPDKYISEIIDESTYDDFNNPIARKASVLCLSLIIIAVSLFIVTHLNSNYILETTEDGYSIKSFQLGIFDDPHIEVPDTIDGKKIVSVSKKAFANNSKIKKVTLADSIIHIGDSAFSNCTRLESISFGNNMQTIGAAGFKNCKTLNTIVIPNGITEIRDNTFDGCSKLETVTLHDEIVDIHAYAFRDCKSLSAIELPSKIKTIHEYTFEECDSLETIYIPRGVTKISAHAFYGCDSLYNVYFPDSVKEIGSSAFRECESLMEVLLPENVSISKRSFEDSPTKLYKKLFTDEQADTIDEELNSINIERIYVLYDKNSGKDSIFSPDKDNSITVSHTEKFRSTISENMDLLEFDKPADLLVYLRKAKQSGIETVTVVFYSEIATNIRGEDFFTSIQLDIDDLITSYENDDSAF